jgi:hypothetical protein
MWSRAGAIILGSFALGVAVYVYGAAANDLTMLDLIIEGAMIAVPIWVFGIITALVYEKKGSQYLHRKFALLANTWLLGWMAAGIIASIAFHSPNPFGFSLAIGLGALLFWKVSPDDGSTYERPEF